MLIEKERKYGLQPSSIVKYESEGLQLKEQSSKPAQTSRHYSTKTQHTRQLGPKTSSIADLTTLLSQTCIVHDAAADAYQSTKAIANVRKDAIDEVVHQVLRPDLKTTKGEKLLPDHPCFDLAREFAKRWDIPDKAVDSHIKLACGYSKFPVILLLNPAPNHEELFFDDMVKNCTTLQWIETALDGIGLNLADVIILDACTLLCSDRIRLLNKEGKKWKALSEAYDVTQKMLEMIKPNIVVSCQCSTTFSTWGSGNHIIAREFCSSLRSAKAREVRKASINGRSIDVIQAYHPSGFLNHNRKGHYDPFGKSLKELFQRLYSPCAHWKSQHLMLIFTSVTNSVAGNSKYEPKARRPSKRNVINKTTEIESERLRNAVVTNPKI